MFVPVATFEAPNIISSYTVSTVKVTYPGYLVLLQLTQVYSYSYATVKISKNQFCLYEAHCRTSTRSIDSNIIIINSNMQ